MIDCSRGKAEMYELEKKEVDPFIRGEQTLSVASLSLRKRKSKPARRRHWKTTLTPRRFLRMRLPIQTPRKLTLESLNSC